MHADELHTDVDLVRRLLKAQFPEWAGLPVERVSSSGTDNALYRLGDEKVVRLPLIAWARDGVEKDARWLSVLAPLLPVVVPELLGRGKPAASYPWEWGVYRWLEGENPLVEALAEPEALARDIAGFVQALRRVDLADAPASSRGEPLIERDDETRAAIAVLVGTIDTEAAAEVWDAALETAAWRGPPVWLHGDLLRGNLLLRDGRLAGVIDWSLLGLGDPAADLIVAWSVLPSEARDVFRAELGVDDATWARGRGLALSVALIQLPYYKDTNPELAANARHVITEALANVRS
jgi:aminoglycoside phosphotransferase (APT) family kinase protein